VNTYQHTDQVLDFATGNGTAGNESTTAATVPFGSWHMVTVAVDRLNHTAQFYIDGASSGSSTQIRPDFPTLGDLRLGQFYNGGFDMKGAMDEARIQSGVNSSNWVWASWMTVASNATFASYSTVTQQTPALKICASGSNLILNWPASGVGLSIYTTTNLTPPVLWTSATNQPFLTNSQWQITLPPGSDATRFYRLQSS